MRTPLLVHLGYSPWSEKARWALDHHRVAYEKSAHLPMIGETLLRMRARRWRGRVTVPLLIAGDERLGDSFDIAQWADRHGTDAPLVPADRADDVARWNVRSEAILAAGRTRITARVDADEDALIEALPAMFRAPRGIAVGVARRGARFLASKHGYSFDEAGVADATSTMIAELDAIRAGLGGREHLLGSFSFADIACAVALQVVKPVAGPWIRLGPATLRAWNDGDLASRYADLVEWRDATYAKHRG